MVHAGQFLDMLSTSFLTQCAESTRKRAVTWPAGSCTVSSSKIVLLLHTMEGPYIDI